MAHSVFMSCCLPADSPLLRRNAPEGVTLTVGRPHDTAVVATVLATKIKDNAFDVCCYANVLRHTYVGCGYPYLWPAHTSQAARQPGNGQRLALYKGQDNQKLFGGVFRGRRWGGGEANAVE